jgi:membrane-associated phospholipid phosphatase
MTNFSRPSVLLALTAIFALAALIGGPGNPFDVTLNNWAAGLRQPNPQLTSLIVILTQFGSIYATVGLGLASCAWLAFRRRFRVATLLAALVIVERLSVDGLKLAISRPRPDLELLPLMPGSFSYPSGHSANSMAVFTAIALLAAPPAWRRLALAIAIALGLVIGMTRIFLGVHWPSDVIGGWAWGLLLVGLMLEAGRRSGAIEAQHDVIGGHLPPASQD